MSATSESTVSQHSLSATAESTHDRPSSPNLAIPKSQVIQQFATALHQTFMSLLQGDDAFGSMPDTPRPTGKKGAMRYRGVTKHKRTQRFEAHIWEAKKQIYLGGFDTEALAAKSHDVMALRCKGPSSDLLNFPYSDYALLIPLIDKLSRDDVVTSLRNYSKAQFNKKASLGAKGGVHKVAAPRVRRPVATAVAGSPAALSRLTIRTERAVGGNSDEGPTLPAVGERGVGEQQCEEKAAGLRHSPRLLLQPRHHDSKPLEPFTPVASAARAGSSRALRSLSKGPPGSPSSPPRRLLSGHSSIGPLPGSPLGRAGSVARALPSQTVADAIALLESGVPGAGLLFPPAQQHYPARHGSRGGGGGGAGMGLFTPFASPWGSCAGAAAAVAGPGAAVGRVPAMRSRVPQNVSCLDDVDLDGVLSSLAGEEPSLTFSANDEGRLYEWTPVDSAHSGLENTLTGTVLFQSPVQREEHHQTMQALAQDASAGAPSMDSALSPSWDPRHCINLEELPPHYFWPTFIPGLPATPMF